MVQGERHSMSEGWQRVTRAAPCAICGKPDYCTVGTFWNCCMRVASDKPCKNGGWLHPLNGAPVMPRAKEAPEPTIDALSMWKRWKEQTPPTSVAELATVLGVKVVALQLLNVTWAPEHFAWAFPMFNERLDPIGFRLRNWFGKKWSVPGGRNGLFAPAGPPGKICFIAEGESDTSALLSLGLFSIGRPSCNEGAAMLAALLPRLGVRE